MRKVIKRWKAMLLVMCVLVTVMSVTVLAEGENNVGEIKVDQTQENGKSDVNLSSEGESGESESIELTEENVRIEFVEEDFLATYNGEEIKPEIRVILTVEKTGDENEETEGLEESEELEGLEENGEYEELILDSKCYTVEYENNIDATGENEYAYVVVTGVKEEGYEGSVSAPFVIAKKALDNAEILLSASKYLYDGKEKKPDVTVTLDGVKLINGTDYSTTFSNNLEVGTASVTVEGQGNYSGTLKSAYTIVLGKTTVTTTPNYNKNKVSWSKVAGASGYEVYRSTSKDKGYKKIVSQTKTSYTDTNVKFNTSYYYKVRAYRTINGKKVYAEYSSQKKQKVQVGTPAISKISRKSATSLKVSWGKVSGASGYVLYRSTSEKGKYTKIATITKGKTVSYTDTKRSCGKTYYYKIKAYRTVNGKKYYGSYSAVKSGYAKPGKVTWNKTNTTYKSTSITLKWKKVSEATGYEIYRATEKNGKYEVVKTISKNSTLSWKNTGLTKGKVYYYKIRSYKKVGKTKVYSSYSSVFTKSIAGWKYVDGYKLYYDNSGKVVKDVSKLIGKQSSYVIKINKRKNTVTVYAKDGKNGYIIPVKAFICSTGAATPLGTFKTPQKLRWHTLDGPSYGQWCTRITGHILFHSVWYYKPKNTTLSVAQYNKLGTQASHGCVRLTAADAKWIYDNCKLKTKVIIYNSNNPGPLGKPTAYKLKSWHTWDPTDPNTKSKCAKKGCH